MIKILGKITIAGLLALSVISCQTQQEDGAVQSPNAAPNAALTVMSQPNFDNGLIKPWNDENRPFVLDGRDFNFENVKWQELVKDKRVAGIISRATGPLTRPEPPSCQNLTVEPKYPQIKDEAKKHGFLWGSFHVGISSKIMSPEDQAKLYLETAKREEGDVIALDLESFSNSCYMNKDEAIRFINYIKKETGTYPLVYLTGSMYMQIVDDNPQDGSGVFAKTPLWFVRYENDISKCLLKHPERNWWKTYALWQFASEINCGSPSQRKSETFCEVPRERRTPCPFEQRTPDKVVPWVPGVKNDMDINIYNGTKEELKKAWLVNFNR